MKLFNFIKNRNASSSSSKMYYQQVNSIYSNFISGTLTMIMTTVIIAILLLEVVPHRMIYTWLIVNFIIAATRIFVFRVYKKSPKDIKDYKKWDIIISTMIFITSAFWGSYGIVLIPFREPVHLALILLMFGGMSAGAVALYSALSHVFLLYVLPLLLPMAIMLFTVSSKMYHGVGIMAFAFIIILIGSSRNVHNILITSLQLRFENIGLVNILSEENERKEKLNDELKEMLSRVKTLKTLLPICSACKKIRDDGGYWEQVEVYINKQTETEFTHGMCPDCMEKYYGLAAEKRKENKPGDKKPPRVPPDGK